MLRTAVTVAAGEARGRHDAPGLRGIAVQSRLSADAGGVPARMDHDRRRPEDLQEPLHHGHDLPRVRQVRLPPQVVPGLILVERVDAGQ